MKRQHEFEKWKKGRIERETGWTINQSASIEKQKERDMFVGGLVFSSNQTGE